MNEWIKIDEQQAESSWMGYEDFISADGKRVERVIVLYDDKSFESYSPSQQ